MAANYLEYQVPFCYPFNCSIDTKVEADVDCKLWTHLPQHCRINLVVLMSFAALLAVMTIVCNVLILSINFSSKTRRMRKRNPTMNNYSVYVLSLAVADLLVGLVVLPLCLFNFYKEFLNDSIPTAACSDMVHIDTYTSTEAQPVGLLNDGNNVGEEVVSDEKMNLSRASTDVFVQDTSTIPLQLLGVFTHLTLFVSIYTLIAASSDRLYAAKYSALHVHSEITKKTGLETRASWIAKKWRTTRRSVIAVGWVWAFGMLFAVAPFLFDQRVFFRHVGHIFSAMTSSSTYSTVINWYLATLILPLVGIWILNVLICSTLWRRKAQLGIQRRRSLRRESLPDATSTKFCNPSSQKKMSAPQNKNILKHKTFTETRENSSASRTSNTEAKNQQRERRIYNRTTSLHDTSGRQHTWSRNPDYKSSLLRRRVSSLRRAKQMVQLRSSESSITKTLCMVVIAFTAAVLPLVVSLSKITVTENANAQTLNNEVTALTVSLLFLFSNSVVNCVIYGARMRDFRSTLDEHIRAICDKLKNTFCWCCIERSDMHSSEIVSGVFIVSSKHQRSEASEKSSHHMATSTSDRLRHIIRGPSKKSSHLKSPPVSHERSSRDSYEFQTPMICKSQLPKTSTDKADKKAPRPSSSGYRTDPELPSIPDEQGRKRLSEKSDIVDIIEESDLEANSSNQDVAVSSTIRPSSLFLPDHDNRVVSSSVKLRGNAEEIGGHKIRPSSHIPTSLSEARKISSGAAEDYRLLFDYGNRRDSRIMTPTDVCLDIDFSQFAVPSV